MQQRFSNIMDALIQDIGIKSISGYKKEDSIEGDVFELDTYLTKYNHRTLIDFTLTQNEEKLRVRITHIWGYLNLQVPMNEGANQVIRLLSLNSDTYRSMFIGVMPIEENCYLTLNSYHYFLMKWSDEDIGKALSLFFFDFIDPATIPTDGSLTMVQVFA